MRYIESPLRQVNDPRQRSCGGVASRHYSTNGSCVLQRLAANVELARTTMSFALALTCFQSAKSCPRNRSSNLVVSLRLSSFRSNQSECSFALGNRARSTRYRYFSRALSQSLRDMTSSTSTRPLFDVLETHQRLELYGATPQRSNCSISVLEAVERMVGEGAAQTAWKCHELTAADLGPSARTTWTEPDLGEGRSGLIGSVDGRVIGGPRAAERR